MQKKLQDITSCSLYNLRTIKESRIYPNLEAISGNGEFVVTNFTKISFLEGNEKLTLLVLINPQLPIIKQNKNLPKQIAPQSLPWKHFSKS